MSTEAKEPLGGDLITDGSLDDHEGAPSGFDLAGDSGDLETSGTSAAAAAYGTARPQGQWRDIRRRFVRNPLAVAGLVMILIVVFVAIFAPLIAPYSPTHQDLLNTEAPPSAQH